MTSDWRTGASGLWAGTAAIEPHARTGTHFHGDPESVVCVATRTGLEPVVLAPELDGVVDDLERVARVDPSHVTGSGRAPRRSAARRR